MNSRLWLQLIARRSRGRQSAGEGGFALGLSLLVALSVTLGWMALANRSSSSRLGAALQTENREARAVAESGLAIVLGELNRPANRMILARGQMIGTDRNAKLTSWDQPIASGSPLVNPCPNSEITDATEEVRPTELATRLGKGEQGDYIPLAGGSDGDRLTRRFRLVRYELKNADRSAGSAYDPEQVNLQADPEKKFPKRGVGYVEITVEGQVLRSGKAVSTSRVTQEFQVVPKCCNRSFRGPADPSRKAEKTDEGIIPGLYGDDNRACFNDFPPMLLGTGNSPTRNDGGVFTVGSTPLLKNQDNPLEQPAAVPCYTSQTSCGGAAIIDGVPVKRSTIKPPNAPVLGADGIPCDDEDVECQRRGIERAKSLSARSIELINATGGASSNSKDDKFAKDYIRVTGKNLEICNKQYDPNNAATTATQTRFDRSPVIVPGSCELLYDDSNPSDSKNVCARQEVDNFVSYHCRIRNIFVNDFGGKTEADAFANNTLFIDSTGNSQTPNPRINLYINEDWAKTRLASTPGQGDHENDRHIIDTMKANGLSPLGFRSLYTVGGYNDGQIQHVNCGSRDDTSQACLTPAEPKISTRASIVSACTRTYNASEKKVEDLCQNPKQPRSSTVAGEIGDDGYMRGLFFFAPHSTLTVYGDPTVDSDWDSLDLDQGRPQVAAAVWVHRLRFMNRTTEIYVPGPNADFFGLETSWDTRYTPKFTFDFVARGISGRSLFAN